MTGPHSAQHPTSGSQLGVTFIVREYAERQLPSMVGADPATGFLVGDALAPLTRGASPDERCVGEVGPTRVGTTEAPGHLSCAR